MLPEATVFRCPSARENNPNLLNISPHLSESRQFGHISSPTKRRSNGGSVMWIDLSLSFAPLRVDSTPDVRITILGSRSDRFAVVLKSPPNGPFPPRFYQVPVQVPALL